MRVDGQAMRPIWADGDAVGIIDQTKLPHHLTVRLLKTLHDAATAIATMQVRGAPLIGATAAYGMALAAKTDASDAALEHAAAMLRATRPTAVNLHWAIDRTRSILAALPADQRASAAWILAGEIAEEDVKINARIGHHGLALLRSAYERKQASGTVAGPLNILTHCNAGWLATVDWGTATAPIYAAHDAGIPVHVWVDETRPRNQGASLTAWELGKHGVAHTVVVDNCGGHLMQHGLVDLVIVGTDRTTATGDVANKIGTYLKALAAHDNHIPFYVALPSPTIDWTLTDGLRQIPIEQRQTEEVSHISGKLPDGRLATVQIIPDGSDAANYAFDVTPARLITGLITERGVAPASALGLASLFPERAAAAA